MKSYTVIFEYYTFKQIKCRGEHNMLAPSFNSVFEFGMKVLIDTLHSGGYTQIQRLAILEVKEDKEQKENPELKIIN